MAEGELGAWKRPLTRNFSFIVNSLGEQVVTVAEFLHFDCTPPVFTEQDVEIIKNSDLDLKNKTRKLIYLLTYKPPYALAGLYEAFVKIEHEELQKCLEKDVETFRANQKIMKNSPEGFSNGEPLNKEEWERFHNDDVVICHIGPEIRSLYREERKERKKYPMTTMKRGLAVVINNNNFNTQSGLKKREGSEKDAEAMVKILRQLHFDVWVLEDLTDKEIKHCLLHANSWEGHTKAHCFILLIMSHGNKHGVYGTNGAIVTKDEIASYFSHGNCRGLNDKPKVLILQACRAEPSGTGQTEVVERKPVEWDRKDFLLCFPTVEGNVGKRDVDTGSWYIQALSWVLKYESYQSDLQSMLVKVNRLVSEMTQEGKKNWTVPETIGSFRSILYFFPGVMGEDVKPIENTYLGKELKKNPADM